MVLSATSYSPFTSIFRTKVTTAYVLGLRPPQELIFVTRKKSVRQQKRIPPNCMINVKGVLRDVPASHKEEVTPFTAAHVRQQNLLSFNHKLNEQITNSNKMLLL